MVMPMISTEMDEDDQYDSPMMDGMDEKPRYPYGMRLSIDEKMLAKLKIDPSDLFVGGIMHMHALVNITGINISDNGDGQCCTVNLCIENMAIQSEDEENK